MKRSRPKSGKFSRFTRALVPDTYERLVAELMREYPQHSREEIEAAIAEVAQRAARA